jgi:glutamate dehydrogenase
MPSGVRHVDNPFGTDEERAAAALIVAAGKILRSNNREVPEDFFAGLFAHAVVEELIRYDPHQLAELASSLWRFLAERKPGVPKIRFESRLVPGGAEHIESVSIIEIIDEVPFLVSSVLAELAERGIEVRFVVHSVVTVVRDEAGRLTAYKGTKPALGTLSESVLHIHVELIDEEAHRAEIVEGIERVHSASATTHSRPARTRSSPCSRPDSAFCARARGC